jgi:NADP-dependent 3-hydroxy acid dehydrogenase YdfG
MGNNGNNIRPKSSVITGASSGLGEATRGISRRKVQASCSAHDASIACSRW